MQSTWRKYIIQALTVVFTLPLAVPTTADDTAQTDNKNLQILCSPLLVRVDPSNLWKQVGSKHCRMQFWPSQTRVATVLIKTASQIAHPPKLYTSSHPDASVKLFQSYLFELKQLSPMPNESNPNIGLGWYADPLVPIADLRIDSIGIFKPYINQLEGESEWRYFALVAEVVIRGDAKPGKISLVLGAADEMRVDSITLDIDVLDLKPVPAKLDSLFQMRPYRASIASLLLDHGVAPSPPGRPDEADSRWLGLSRSLGFWSGADYSNCMFSEPPGAPDLDKARNIRIAGSRLINFTADEIANCGNARDDLKRWGARLHASQVAQLVTIPPDPALVDLQDVDIWGVLPHQMKAPHVKAAIDSGLEVWGYTALAQDPYSPKWLIDAPLGNYRLFPGFYAFSAGWRGILYWSVNSANTDPWQLPGMSDREKRIYWGEGFLVYPAKGASDQYWPSIRLKAIRDGVTDYAIVSAWIACYGPSRAKHALSQVFGSLERWSSSPTDLESVRSVLLSALSSTECRDRLRNYR